MGNSIFDNPEYESPLGNWLQQDNAGSGSSLKKELTIQFLNAQSNSYVPYTGFATINFEVKAKNLHTGSAVLSITDYNFKGTLKGTPTTKNVYIKPSGTSTVNISIRASLLQYTDIQFEAKIICDGIESSTGKFEVGESSAVSNKCFCNRNIEKNEIVRMIYFLREKEKFIQKREWFFNKGPEFIPEIRIVNGKLSDKNNEKQLITFTNALNAMFLQFKINTCKRKIHFLAQMYLETMQFTSTYENRTSVPENYRGGVPFQGRGMKQITHDYNYLGYYDYVNNTSLYSVFEKFCKRDHKGRIIEGVGECVKSSSSARNAGLNDQFYENLKIFAKNLSSNLFHAFNSAGWYSTINAPKTLKFMDEGLEEVNVKNVTVAINGGETNITERKNYTKWIREFIKYDERCSNR